MGNDSGEKQARVRVTFLAVRLFKFLLVGGLTPTVGECYVRDATMLSVAVSGAQKTRPLFLVGAQLLRTYKDERRPTAELSSVR